MEVEDVTIDGHHEYKVQRLLEDICCPFDGCPEGTSEEEVDYDDPKWDNAPCVECKYLSMIETAFDAYYDQGALLIEDLKELLEKYGFNV